MTDRDGLGWLGWDWLGRDELERDRLGWSGWVWMGQDGP
jgi:hypothetical protein